MNTLHPLLVELLEKRGIEPEDQEQFVRPDFSRDTHNPFLMKGMDVAVDRILNAIENGEKIAIFGDYDADGVPATALLVRAFQGLGVDVTPYIPTRQAGYGLTLAVVQTLQEARVNLLITVDNGTVAKVEIAELAELGIDVIVCDHHQPDAEHIADRAIAILNPKQVDCQYPFNELCGCAIAWKLAWALYEKMGKNPDSLKWLLDLVALSTVADMVPLVGENRVLTVFGLKVFRKTRNLGLKALVEVAGSQLETISAGVVSFRVAPRINAPSRMHQEVNNGEHTPLQLLLTEDEKVARQLASVLVEQNKERQSVLERHLQEAESLAAEQVKLPALVVYKEDWSTGVIGLVAGRLMEKYKRPVIVLAKEGEEIKGSVRSVEGVNAVDWLHSGEEYLSRFGGHSKAAGLSMRKGAQVKTFQASLVRWLEGNQHTIETLEKGTQRKTDREVKLEQLDLELAELLHELEPFGIGFPEPLFQADCEITKIRLVGKEKQHLACWLKQGATEKKAIGFSQAGVAVKEGTLYTVLFNLDVEEWNNQKSATCSIKQILL